MLYLPMPFHMPGSDVREYQELKITRGQLYNLDLNEQLTFQFNPEVLRVVATDGWVPVGMGIRGRDMAFVSEGTDSFDLQLLFVADPGAPDVLTRNIPERVTWGGATGGSGKADFDAIGAVIDRWRKPLPQTGLPSRIMVVYGFQAWEGIIRERRLEFELRFATGATRVGTLRLKFEEWSPITTEEGTPA